MVQEPTAMQGWSALGLGGTARNRHKGRMRDGYDDPVLATDHDCPAL